MLLLEKNALKIQNEGGKDGISMKTIVTIGRQYGSGGKEIGRKLADALGVPFYDEELANAATESTNAHPDVVKKADERATNSFLYTLVANNGLRGISDAVQYEMPINDKVFISQSKYIKEVAAKGGCVIVGRCADYVLDGNEKLLRIFLYADMDSKIKRIMQLYSMTEKQAKDKIVKTEKTRKTYYNYYTDRSWGNIASYDLCLNVGVIGIDETVEMIKSYILKKENADG